MENRDLGSIKTTVNANKLGLFIQPPCFISIALVFLAIALLYKWEVNWPISLTLGIFSFFMLLHYYQIYKKSKFIFYENGFVYIPRKGEKYKGTYANSDILSTGVIHASRGARVLINFHNVDESFGVQKSYYESRLVRCIEEAIELGLK